MRLNKQIVGLLSCFKQVSDLVSGEKFPTLASAVCAINLLIDKIEEVTFELDAKPERNEIDEHIILTLQTGINKILKNYHKTNWISCTALILDPRYKLETFDLTDWGRDLKVETEKKFRKIYKERYWKSDNVEKVLEKKEEKRGH